MFIEGRRLADEALRSDINVVECFVAEGFNDEYLLNNVLARCSAVAEVPEKIFTSLADTEHSQGIILIGKRPHGGRLAIERALVNAAVPVVIFLHEINNPSNLGAVLRTAEAAGVAGVIASRKSADVYSPKSLRASMGAGFRLPVWNNVAFDQATLWAKEKGLGIRATAASAELAYTEADWRRRCLLIFGSEAHGLSPDQIRSVDQTICIPMSDGVESLNLAVSAGVVLFEAKRQIEAIT
jgi:TrmH family RNA methyltransferase